MTQVRQNLGGIMRNESSQNSNCPLSNFEILILHAVEKHKKIFIPRNERIELGIQMFKHSHTDPVFVVSCCCYEKSVKQFVDYTLDVRADLKLVC